MDDESSVEFNKGADIVLTAANDGGPAHISQLRNGRSV